MQIVTLTSDFGHKDHYAPLIKGALLSQVATLNIVDISHEIDPYDIVHAAFILKNSFSAFPKGTIHIVSVNNYDVETNSFIAVEYLGHFFIAPNNGVLSLIFDTMPTVFYELDFDIKANFPLKKVFANAVAHIAKGNLFSEIGYPIQQIVRKITLQPVVFQEYIQGTVIHIDNYDNAIVNITQSIFEKARKNRDFVVMIKKHSPITALVLNYNDVAVGETHCIFNSAGYLEIAIRMGKAASLLGIQKDDTVRIEFI